MPRVDLAEGIVVASDMGKLSRSVPVLVGVLVGASLVPVLWRLAHRLKGGAELPAPLFTEADLVALPPMEDNAWYVIGPSHRLPELTNARLVDPVAVSVARRVALDSELARPDVRALLQTVPEVLSRSTLVSPREVGGPWVDVFRLSGWQAWVELWLGSRLAEDPRGVAEHLSKSFPLWIGCANAARATVDYLVCANEAERELRLLTRTVGRLVEVGDYQTLARVERAVRSVPRISAENVRRADYILGYTVLAPRISLHRPVDLRATVDLFNSFYDPATATTMCETSTDVRRFAFYEYNYIGKSFATLMARGFHCMGRPHVEKATNRVALERDSLLEQLQQNP